MKSFLNKVNIENFQVTLKYNNINLDDFLIDNDYKCSVKDIFYVLKKYKNEFFNNEEVLRNIINKLLKNRLDIIRIDFSYDYRESDFFHIYRDVSEIVFHMFFVVDIKSIDVVIRL